MTLIEIMVVMTLIALLMGTLVFGSGMLGGAERRATATLVVAGVRKGLAHANSIGKPVRLVFDFEGRRIYLEESLSSQALRSDQSNPDGESEQQRLLREAQEEADRIATGATTVSQQFRAIDALGDGLSDDEEDGQPGRALGQGVRLVLVQTEHDDEPITEGKAYIYFWPGGMTERAVVQVARGDDDDGLTVEVSPLTGRAKISRGRVSLPEPRFGDDEYSERDEL